MPASPASLVHQAMLTGLIADGAVPAPERLAERTGLDRDGVRRATEELEAAHALVLHPGTEEVWVIPPFALVPTAFWVANARRGWWASCIWCALGVCALVDGPARIHTRLGGESEEVVIEVSAEGLRPAGLVAHFPVPVARAWDNVHRFCGSTLVFRDREQVAAWCARHGHARGDVQPLDVVDRLARAWYGGHLAPDWTKWTAAQAAAIFEACGLGGPTWSLPPSDDRF